LEAAMRPIPNRAVDFVGRFEGLRLTSYLCPAGVWTVGYGSTRGVTAGMRITKDEARKRLADDLKEAAARLQSVVKREVIDELNDAQYVALLSFVFNLGANGSWQIWKLLNAGKLDAVPAQLSRFVNAGGRRLQGLVNRRNAECALWDEGSPDEELPSSFTRSEPTPPTPEPVKPMAQSKTAWTGGAIAAVGAMQAGVQQVQALAAPQAQHSPWLGQLLGLTAMLIVAGGVAILVFKWFDKRNAKR
jgi:lysozyme